MATSSNDTLDAIGRRATYSVFANALRQHEIDAVGVGWLSTKAKLEALLTDTEKSAEVSEKLSSIYEDNLLFVHKAVSIWKIETSHAETIASQLEKLIDGSSPYIIKYPLPISNDELKHTRVQCTPTGIHQRADSRTLVFVSRREKVEEEVFDRATIPVEMSAAGFTELVGRKKSFYQVFDSVTITPSLGVVEIRIDLAKGMSEKDIVNFRETIRLRFNQLVLSTLGLPDILGAAVNLAPALSALYRGTAWTVSRIGHQNEGGYSNTNRGRHRTNDVRKDEYHSSGEAAVEHLQLWSVAATFKSPDGAGLPMLILEGHSRMLSATLPFLDIASLVDCASENDYSLLRGTLLNCLNPPGTEAAANDSVINQDNVHVVPDNISVSFGAVIRS